MCGTALAAAGMMLTVAPPALGQSIPAGYRADMLTATVPTGSGLLLEAQVLEGGRLISIGMNAAHDGRCLSPAGASLPAHPVATARYAAVVFRCDVLIEGAWTLAFQVDVGGATQTLSAAFVAARPSVASSTSAPAGPAATSRPSGTL